MEQNPRMLIEISIPCFFEFLERQAIWLSAGTTKLPVLMALDSSINDEAVGRLPNS